MSIFDKHLSEEKRASLELAEASREKEWKYPSFALKLFHGFVDWPLIHPFPIQSPEEKKQGDKFLFQLEKLLKEKLDPDEVDRTGIIPPAVIQGLADIKAFAIKIPQEYGGLGLSQVNYNRAVHLVASFCGSTAVLLSAHQSIGVPQPLKLFGTPEQKKKYLPKFAEGMISAFALTEEAAGSDPRQMTTTATPIEEGKYYLLNGEKLWCTNGPIAGVIVVMAVTPPKIIHGKEQKQFTAFIMETETPGFEVVHRCQFMGLHGIQNGLIRFKNVKVPRENIILGEGEGLKLALTTLNTGRLTLPAASAGIAKWCLHVARQWAVKRKQWGHPIGEHESIGLKLGSMAGHTFAIDAVSSLTAAMADDQKKDIRLEAAMAKHFCTYHSWKIVDDTLQIRGGQGYEQASSLRARGADYWPVERVLRDVRINLIIEGTSEIMHLFIAREALDPHLTRFKTLLDSHLNFGKRMQSASSISLHYLTWYLKLWKPCLKTDSLKNLPGNFVDHLSFIDHKSRCLARMIFHAMVKYQKKLESKQSLLNRIVDIGTDLFAMASSLSYAGHLAENTATQNAIELADLFCWEARKRIMANFRENQSNHDPKTIRIAQGVLAKEFEWLESDIIK